MVGDKYDRMGDTLCGVGTLSRDVASSSRRGAHNYIRDTRTHVVGGLRTLKAAACNQP